MAKPTKTETSTPANPAKKEATAPLAGGVDISSLTPEQLVNLQKQLKERKKGSKADKVERFTVIDGMLKDKDEKGEFRWTTRDIMNRLRENKLADETSSDSDEIKKIQARKQHLEKKTDEKGKLVYAAGTFGYKTSSSGFMLTPEKIASWFTTDNVAKLSATAKQTIAAAVK